jgi:hypothetical protein
VLSLLISLRSLLDVSISESVSSVGTSVPSVRSRKAISPRVRLHGVDPAYHGWNRLGVHRDLDPILAGGVKAKHATSRIDGASFTCQ